MKRIAFIIVSLLLIIELGCLIRETYTYTKNKACSTNINGRIVSEIDNLINFSGMTSH